MNPIVITERDRSILAKLADYRILTTEQIFRLCFPSPSRARKRLYQLWQHGYLKRIIRPMRMGEGSSMYLYLPTKSGLRLISPEHSLKPISKRPPGYFTDHTLAINNFRICLELAVKARKDISLDSWKEGKGLLMKASVKGDNGSVKQIPIIPDGYFALKYHDRLFHYFLEIDRGTTDLKRIAIKCRGYLNLWQEKIVQAKFGIRSFRVLYITNGEKRLFNMLQIFRRLKAHYARLDIILMTNDEAFSLDKPDKLFNPIWRTVDGEGNIRNISILPITSPQSSRQRAENHHCAAQTPIPVNGHPGPGG